MVVEWQKNGSKKKSMVESMVENMKTIIKLNGKKISKKKAVELFGKEKVENRIKEAKESFMNDPYEINSWMDGMEIEFK